VSRYVYLMFATERGDYKLGISKNPAKRVKQLQTGSGEQIELLDLFLTPYPFEVETSLHGLYAPDHNMGEWFNIGVVEANSFQERCRLFDEFYRLKNTDIDF
jgi:hypothetical protein